MTIFHVLIVWLLIAVLSVLPLILGALRARRYWSVVEMRLLIGALAGQALSQSIAAWLAFTALPLATLDRPAPIWLIFSTIGNIAAVLPLVVLALRMLHYRVE